MHKKTAGRSRIPRLFNNRCTGCGPADAPPKRFFGLLLQDPAVLLIYSITSEENRCSKIEDILSLIIFQLTITLLQPGDILAFIILHLTTTLLQQETDRLQKFPRVENDGERPVVREGDLHVRTEFAVFDNRDAFAAAIQDVFVKFFRMRG